MAQATQEERQAAAKRIQKAFRAHSMNNLVNEAANKIKKDLQTAYKMDPKQNKDSAKQLLGKIKDKTEQLNKNTSKDISKFSKKANARYTTKIIEAGVMIAALIKLLTSNSNKKQVTGKLKQFEQKIKGLLAQSDKYADRYESMQTEQSRLQAKLDNAGDNPELKAGLEKDLENLEKDMSNIQEQYDKTTEELKETSTELNDYADKNIKDDDLAAESDNEQENTDDANKDNDPKSLEEKADTLESADDIEKGLANASDRGSDLADTSTPAISNTPTPSLGGGI